jgi:hypothetical protein
MNRDRSESCLKASEFVYCAMIKQLTHQIIACGYPLPAIRYAATTPEMYLGFPKPTLLLKTSNRKNDTLLFLLAHHYLCQQTPACIDERLTRLFAPFDDPHWRTNPIYKHHRMILLRMYYLTQQKKSA